MTRPLLLIVQTVLSAGVAAVCTPLMCRLAVAVGAIDEPGPRKVHTHPIPRLGGLAIVVSSAVVLSTTWLEPIRSLGTIPAELLVGLVAGLIPILTVSVIDDVRPLGFLPKFLAHGAGAAIAISVGIRLAPTVHLFGQGVQIGWLAVPLSFVWLVGVTNAFNLVDGLDGLSAGLALISAGSLAVIFFAARQPAMVSASLIIAGALLGFLPYNFHPARIFLGDSGATAIGFALACFALRGGSTTSAGFAVLLPIVVMGLPIAETLVSMARRVLRGLERHTGSQVFVADRNHFHHRLLALGIDHRRVVWILYAAGLVMALAGLLSILMTALEAGLLLLALLLAGLVGISRLDYEEFALIRSGVLLRFYDHPMLQRSLFGVFADLALVGLAVYATFVIKFENLHLGVNYGNALLMFAVLAPATVACFWVLDLYKGTWRFASVDDFYRLSVGVVVSTAVGSAGYRLLASDAGSLSWFVVYALVKIVAANGTRASYRVLATKQKRAERSGARALIYGAGRAGATALREMLLGEAIALQPVGFLDDDPAKTGKSVNGYQILGTSSALTQVARAVDAQALVVSSRKISPDRIRLAEATCETLGIRFLRLSITFDSRDEPISTHERPQPNSEPSTGFAAGGDR